MNALGAYTDDIQVECGIDLIEHSIAPGQGVPTKTRAICVHNPLR